MKLRKCEFCGTEFDAALGQCPLCGKAVQPGADEPQPVMPAAYKPAGGHGGKFSKKKGGRVVVGRGKPPAQGPPTEMAPHPWVKNLPLDKGIICGRISARLETKRLLMEVRP